MCNRKFTPTPPTTQAPIRSTAPPDIRRIRENRFFETVQARQFILVDEAGRIRGGLGMTDAGYPTLGLTEYKRHRLQLRAELSLAPDGPQLGLYDSSGALRLALAANGAGVSIALGDRKGKTRLCFQLTPKNVVELEMHDSRGRRIDFVQRVRPPFTQKQAMARLTPLVKAGKKAAFGQAIGELFGVADSAQVDDLWRCARRERQGRARKPRQAAAAA